MLLVDPRRMHCLWMNGRFDNNWHPCMVPGLKQQLQDVFMCFEIFGVCLDVCEAVFCVPTSEAVLFGSLREVSSWRSPRWLWFIVPLQERCASFTKAWLTADGCQERLTGCGIAWQVWNTKSHGTGGGCWCPYSILFLFCRVSSFGAQVFLKNYTECYAQHKMPLVQSPMKYSKSFPPTCIYNTVYTLFTYFFLQRLIVRRDSIWCSLPRCYEVLRHLECWCYAVLADDPGLHNIYSLFFRLFLLISKQVCRYKFLTFVWTARHVWTLIQIWTAWGRGVCRLGRPVRNYLVCDCFLLVWNFKFEAGGNRSKEPSFELQDCDLEPCGCGLKAGPSEENSKARLQFSSAAPWLNDDKTCIPCCTV